MAMVVGATGRYISQCGQGARKRFTEYGINATPAGPLGMIPRWPRYAEPRQE